MNAIKNTSTKNYNKFVQPIVALEMKKKHVIRRMKQMKDFKKKTMTNKSMKMYI